MSEFPHPLLTLEAEFGPITHNFRIDFMPEGGAPEETRRLWVGTILPVRESLLEGPTDYKDDLTGEQRHNPRPVSVLVEDAVIALINDGKQEAANFWGSLFNPRAILTFRESEGLLTQAPDENHQH